MDNSVDRLLVAACMTLAGLAAALQPASAVEPHPSTDWRVRSLHVNGGAFRGHDLYSGRSPLDRSTVFACGYHSLYVSEVLPGHQYTLGMSYPGAIPNVVVSLYDRWPYAAGARRLDLPLGTFVARRDATLEYRWQIGISRNSASTVLYVAVATDRCDARLRHLPYRLFVTEPPLIAGSAMGSGITYLQGPGDWVLAGGTAPVSYAVEETIPQEVVEALQRVPVPGDLIANGWFIDGLDRWKLHRNYQISPELDGISVHDGRLRIASDDNRDRIGVLQLIDKDVAAARSLILRAELRVEKQTEPGTGTSGRTAPIAIAVCYEDADGRSHCDANAHWIGFYGLASKEADHTPDGQKVPRGVWYRYVVDLMQLDPKPRFIRYLSLEGAGLAEREGWIRDVHLIETGGNP